MGDKRKYKFTDAEGDTVEIPQEIVDEIKEDVKEEVMDELEKKDDPNPDGQEGEVDAEPAPEQAPPSIPDDIEAAKALIGAIYEKFPELKPKDGDGGKGEEEAMKRVREMERKLSLLAFKDRSREADEIWHEKLSGTAPGTYRIPVTFHDRCKKSINPEQFVDKDGVFQKNKFTEAVESEVVKWEKDFSGISNGNQTFMGMSFVEQQSSGTGSMVDRLYGLSRQGKMQKKQGGK